MSAPGPDPSGPAPVFAALGDPTRLALLARLSEGQARSIAGLSSEARMTRQAVTKHLRVLENVGLVSSIRLGRETRFAYNPAPVGEAKTFLDKISAQWDGALTRLRGLVEP